ncbi:MAG TPA: ROK family protein, partial [Anaerolineaceae bacterium]|nr:ROK family protein [Anaerolineaceae bacterium]
NTTLASWFEQKMGVPVAFETDVNVAALGEYTWGAGQGLENILYITIGTGIGGGALINGQPLHGLVHPEMGHIAMPHDWKEDPFSGACPFHGDCFEGVAAGPAILKRWGVPGQDLPADHPAWKIEAEYISAALVTFICTLSPQRIILGGGVMDQPDLLPMVRERTLRLLNGYVQSPEILEHIDRYIVSPGLSNRSGMLGAIALIRQKLNQMPVS